MSTQRTPEEIAKLLSTAKFIRVGRPSPITEELDEGDIFIGDDPVACGVHRAFFNAVKLLAAERERSAAWKAYAEAFYLPTLSLEAWAGAKARLRELGEIE